MSPCALCLWAFLLVCTERAGQLCLTVLQGVQWSDQPLDAE